MQIYGISLIKDRFFPIFCKFALTFQYNVMNYIEIKFYLSPDSSTARDLLTAIAGETGCESFIENNGAVIAYCQEENFDELILNKALADFPLPNTKISFTTSKVEDRNWNEEWEQNNFKPIIIEHKCLICNTKDALQAKKLSLNGNSHPLIIEINPCKAFGTGTHETTQMIVSQLFNMDLKGKSVLDCGCGTGILGIVASKLGARKVCAYDVDSWSVKNTIDNMKQNDVTLKVLEGNKHVINKFETNFDVILANINRNIVLDDMDSLAAVLNKDGFLILSGFYTEDIELILDKSKSLNLRLCLQKEEHRWCCLVLQPA